MKRAVWTLVLSLAATVSFAATPTPTRTPRPTVTPTPTKTNTPLQPRIVSGVFIRAATDMPGGRFVGFDDAVVSISGGYVKGVLERALPSGQTTALTSSGPAEVYAGGSLRPGDPVKSDDSGRAVVAEAGNWVVGYVVSTRTDGTVTLATIILGGAVNPFPTNTFTNTPTATNTPTRTPTP